VCFHELIVFQADAFVPQHLYNIQRETHTLIPLPPIPVFPSVSYLQSFLLPPLIDESHKSDNFSLLNAPPIPKDSKTPLLDHLTYHNHWTEILRWELDAIAEKKEGIVLWKLGLKVVLWKDSEFVLFVPGIRENHPYLEVGDLVHMREVTMHENRRQALEGRVVALRKREGLIRKFFKHDLLAPTHIWVRYTQPSPPRIYPNVCETYSPNYQDRKWICRS